MYMRIGKVTNIYPTTGKIKVMYEDERSASLPLSMLTMNQEYSMPAVGDKVVTVHMANGSSKGFVLGTYYGGGMQPKANTGYRKDFGSGAYATCIGGVYFLKTNKATVSGGGARLFLGSLGNNAIMTGEKVLIGSAISDGEEISDNPVLDVCLEITDEEALLKALTSIVIEAKDGPVEIKSMTAEASIILDEETVIKATKVTVEAEDIILKCSYGEVTVEELMKRLERIEDQLGLPHTIE